MTTYAIYEAAGEDREPVIVLGWASTAGEQLPALLPNELEQQAVYAIVRRNAGFGARQLVEAGRIHSDELGRCSVAHRRLIGYSPNAHTLTCTEHGVMVERFAAVEAAQR